MINNQNNPTGQSNAVKNTVWSSKAQAVEPRVFNPVAVKPRNNFKNYMTLDKFRDNKNGFQPNEEMQLPMGNPKAARNEGQKMVNS